MFVFRVDSIVIGFVKIVSIEIVSKMFYFIFTVPQAVGEKRFLLCNFMCINEFYDFFGKYMSNM